MFTCTYILIVNTSLNLQLRNQQIVVTAGIIEARITAAVLRDYDGMRVKKMFKCTNFTYCEDIPQFTITALTNCGRGGNNSSRGMSPFGSPLLRLYSIWIRKTNSPGIVVPAGIIAVRITAAAKRLLPLRDYDAMVCE